MIQHGAVYAQNVQYIRIKESGCVYPVHPEQAKLVGKDLAEFVTFNGEGFDVVPLEVDDEPKKPISTPARRPAAPVAKPVARAPVVEHAPAPPVIDLSINEE